MHSRQNTKAGTRLYDQEQQEVVLHVGYNWMECGGWTGEAQL